jgi:hypothetical protein
MITTPRILTALAVAGVLAGGVAVSSESNADNEAPVTAGRTAVPDRPDISARHSVPRGPASIRAAR